MPAAAVDRDHLLSRLERGEVDGAVLDEASTIFRERGDGPRVRWMQCEMLGYGATTNVPALRYVLGPNAPQEIIGAAMRARLRRGRVRLGAKGPMVVWPHFFVEPIDTLLHFRDSISPSMAGNLIVDLGPGEVEGPRSLSFPVDVFGDIVRSIALEVADAIRRAE